MTRRRSTLLLVTASVIALAGFAWPLVGAALPAQARASLPWLAIAIVLALTIVAALALDRELSTARVIALLGVLTALGTAVRVAGAGIGGVELVFILLILAGRALGPRFGMLLGLTVIVFSSLFTGGIGPWTPFQMFACGWVAAGAGLLPAVRSRVGEVAVLAGYGVVAAYLFGLVANLWFWPFAVGFETSISYRPEAGLGENLASFWLYSLATSTLTWDTVRAITTAVGVALVGRPLLAALRRARAGGPLERSAAPPSTRARGRVASAGLPR